MLKITSRNVSAAWFNNPPAGNIDAANKRRDQGMTSIFGPSNGSNPVAAPPPPPGTASSLDGISCSMCNIFVPDLEEAMEQGWYPDWYDRDDQQQGPVCPACAKKYLRRGADGELELK